MLIRRLLSSSVSGVGCGVAWCSDIRSEGGPAGRPHTENSPAATPQPTPSALVINAIRVRIVSAGSPKFGPPMSMELWKVLLAGVAHQEVHGVHRDEVVAGGRRDRVGA